MNSREDIERLVEENLEELQECDSALGGVFINQQEESNGVFLEVEIKDRDIAFSVSYELAEFTKGWSPQDAYNELKDCLEENDINVIEDLDEWEEVVGD